MTTKRPGRFGDGPPPADRPFGERRGAPLPLLTQPMVAVEIRRDPPDPSEASSTRIDGPAGLDPPPGRPGALLGRSDGPSRLEPAHPTLKIDPTGIAMGRPTIEVNTPHTVAAHLQRAWPASPAPQVGAPGAPQIDLTQHHLPDGPPDPRLTLVIDPDSERSAAFRVLRHHLLEIGRPQVVIVTSPGPGDGKTTTAVNLALALAECGRARTLLVETHVRRPQLTEVFKFVPPWCFAEQLATHRHQPTMPWSLVDVPQLWLHLAAINPRIVQTQLLDGPAFAIAMERLRAAGYDHIVVDAPPVLGSADVNLMADAADSVVFALRARRSTTRDLRRAAEQLGGRKVAGTVLLLDR
jgi:Mrp family chromosome partitioning ATPase